MTALELQRINSLPGQSKQVGRPNGSSPVNGGFRDLLNNVLNVKEGVKFSAHATERLFNRKINLSQNDIARLNDAVSKAGSKGSTDSLILMNDLAFVVSVKNNTVVTAMSSEQLKDNVITNIDSTVFI